MLKHAYASTITAMIVVYSFVPVYNSVNISDASYLCDNNLQLQMFCWFRLSGWFLAGGECWLWTSITQLLNVERRLAAVVYSIIAANGTCCLDAAPIWLRLFVARSWRARRRFSYRYVLLTRWCGSSRRPRRPTVRPSVGRSVCRNRNSTSCSSCDDV